MKANWVYQLGEKNGNEGSIVSEESEQSKTTKKPHRRNDEALCSCAMSVDGATTGPPSEFSTDSSIDPADHAYLSLVHNIKKPNDGGSS